MVEVLCVGDLHLSDVPPTNCFDTYNDDLFALLDEVCEVVQNRRPAAVVFAGDLFHVKRPDRTSHGTVQRMIDVVHRIRRQQVPVYLVVGNHDIQHDRIESIHETQPFGVLLRAGAKLLDGWSAEVPVFGMGWQQDWQNPDNEYFVKWLTEGDSRFGSLDHCLFVTHCPLYPPGRELPWEFYPAQDLAANLQTGFVYYGHVHDYHGVYQVESSPLHSPVVFCNQGALSRGSLHDEDFFRKPAVTMWHSDRSGPEAFERIELVTAKPGEQVFKVLEHQEREDYRERLEGFLSSVGQATVSLTSVESVLAVVKSMELSDPEIKLAVEVLEQAATGSLK